MNTGHWELTIRNSHISYQSENSWRCSCCGVAYPISGFPNYANFCPSCGANMSEEPQLNIKVVQTQQYNWE